KDQNSSSKCSSSSGVHCKIRGTSHTPPVMEARKPIVCGLSARGMIPPPLPQEDTDDDFADVTPSEVEV
ncbi:unnamed protein product, partial [Brassica oleracea var. botrytis]